LELQGICSSASSSAESVLSYQPDGILLSNGQVIRSCSYAIETIRTMGKKPIFELPGAPARLAMGEDLLLKFGQGKSTRRI
jgi:carbamoylphosphate synthase small subunit